MERHTVTITDIMVMMTFAIAEIMALMPLPIAETMEPYQNISIRRQTT